MKVIDKKNNNVIDRIGAFLEKVDKSPIASAIAHITLFGSIFGYKNAIFSLPTQLMFFKLRVSPLTGLSLAALATSINLLYSKYNVADICLGDAMTKVFNASIAKTIGGNISLINRNYNICMLDKASYNFNLWILIGTAVTAVTVTCSTGNWLYQKYQKEKKLS